MPVQIHITETETFTPLLCGGCGIRFYIPEALRMARKEDGGTWTCPNGHERHYVRTEVQELREKVERLERDLQFRTEQYARVAEDRDRLANQWARSLLARKARRAR